MFVLIRSSNTQYETINQTNSSQFYLTFDLPKKWNDLSKYFK